MFIYKSLNLFIASIVIVCLFGTLPQQSYAQVADPRVAKVSFTFDDGFESTLTQGATTLRKYNLKGTVYVSTGCVNNSGPCRTNVNPPAKYITWTQIGQLKNTYGWEIGAHTVNHKRLSELSASEKETELKGAKDELAKRGFVVTNFASPEGDYDYPSLAIAAKYYNTHRGFWDQSVNTWPYNDNIINVVQVQAGVTVTQVKAKIDQAILNKQWVVLVFHDIKTTASTNPDDYEYRTSDLDQIANYVRSKQSLGQIQPVTVAEAMTVTKPNLLQNGSFANGIANGWVTDNAPSVTKDTSSKGQFPSPGDSIKFAGSTKNSHLFTPAVAANPNATYAFKAFVNTLSKTAGEFGFYIDEYDAAGNWVSGKWLGAIWLPTVSHFATTYTPTSTNVKSFKIQTYLSGNSGGTVYVDNYQLYNMNASQPNAVPTPIPTVVPTKAPTQTPLTPTIQPTSVPQVNLVPNPSFEEVTNGFAANWEKDSLSFSIDSNTLGNSGPNSLKLVPNAANSHVFSQNIIVNPRSTYKWRTYVNSNRGAGEFGFYVDQYDDAGNWQGGQWKGMLSGPTQGIKEFEYAASVPTVTNIRLQYYAVQNSGITLYLDSIYFGL
jgi:peptidoglycan/xylan/chitin deacetylase (PgdA/CDA1 family)